MNILRSESWPKSYLFFARLIITWSYLSSHDYVDDDVDNIFNINNNIIMRIIFTCNYSSWHHLVRQCRLQMCSVDSDNYSKLTSRTFSLKDNFCDTICHTQKALFNGWLLSAGSISRYYASNTVKQTLFQ